METTYAGQRKTKKRNCSMQKMPLLTDLRKTPRELKIDLIGYYLARGEIEKAVEVANKKMVDRNFYGKPK